MKVLHMIKFIISRKNFKFFIFSLNKFNINNKINILINKKFKKLSTKNGIGVFVFLEMV